MSKKFKNTQKTRLISFERSLEEIKRFLHITFDNTTVIRKHNKMPYDTNYENWSVHNIDA